MSTVISRQATGIIWPTRAWVTPLTRIYGFYEIYASRLAIQYRVLNFSGETRKWDRRRSINLRMRLFLRSFRVQRGRVAAVSAFGCKFITDLKSALTVLKRIRNGRLDFSFRVGIYSRNVPCTELYCIWQCAVCGCICGFILGLYIHQYCNIFNLKQRLKGDVVHNRRALYFDYSDIFTCCLNYIFYLLYYSEVINKIIIIINEIINTHIKKSKIGKHA